MNEKRSPGHVLESEFCFGPTTNQLGSHRRALNLWDPPQGKSSLSFLLGLSDLKAHWSQTGLDSRPGPILSHLNK